MTTTRRSPDQWQAAINRNRAIAMSANLNGAAQIYKGRYFWPLEPRHPGNDYDIETIAHGLASLPRWGGQTADAEGNPLRYSVAQHSVYVSILAENLRYQLVPNWDWSLSGSPALVGLLHDAPEQYGIADLVRPVKANVPGYKELDEALCEEVYAQFNAPLDMAIREAVRRVDNMMIFLERDELVGQPVVPYSNEMDHPRMVIRDLFPDFRAWTARYAKERFIERYEEILSAQ